MKIPFNPKPVPINPDMAPGDYVNVNEIEKRLMVNNDGLSISCEFIDKQTTYRFDNWPENIYKNAPECDLAEYVPVSHPFFDSFFKYVNLPGMSSPGYTSVGEPIYPGHWIEYNNLEIFSSIIKTMPAKYRYRMVSWPDGVYKIVKANKLANEFPELLKNHPGFDKRYLNNC